MPAHASVFNRYEGINAVVLGASGFIGRWVARSLTKVGARLTLAVRNKATSQKIFAEYNIIGDVFVVDLTDVAAVKELFATVRPAITFNLAGYGVDRAERDETTAYQCNTQLVKFVCRSVAENRDESWSGQAVIHVGSILEYGEIGGNLAEDSVPNPTTVYGRSKLAGTVALARCCQDLKIRGLTARLFTVYGPGEHDGRLLPSLIEAATNRQALRLTSGQQERDFTFVDDVAEGLLRLGLVQSGKAGEVVNLATNQLTSVRTFVETAASILKLDQESLIFGALPTRGEEMRHAAVTVDRLQQLTSWKPPTTIQEGILQTLQFQSKTCQYGGPNTKY